MKIDFDKKMNYKYFIVFVFLAAFLGVLVGTFLASSLLESNEARIADYYYTEHAVSVSPSTFVRDLQNGKVTALIVDLRSTSEYEKAHLVTSINIPASQMTSKDLVDAFRNLPTDKPIVTYCYSSYCTLSRSVGKTLADNGIYVKHLTAGWHEINRDFSDFLVSGSEPGIFANDSNIDSTVCSIDATGEFGC